MEVEHEAELHKPLPYIDLIGGLYTEYATSSPAFFGGEKRPEIIGKATFPKKFS